MALRTAAAANRGRGGGGGGRGALCLTAALQRPISSRFTQDAKNHGDNGGKRESDGDEGGGRPANMAGFVAEKAKKGTRKAAEMVFEKGESTAEGKKESWGYVKETSQKIKHDLLGDTDSDTDGDEHGKTHHHND